MLFLNFKNFTAVCVPICENNGQCIEPNECSCPKKYEGSQCEFEKGCKTNPTTENAKPNCNTDTCEITCNTGYEFPDGSTKMDLKCEERRWIPYLKQNFEPNCKRKTRFQIAMCMFLNVFFTYSHL